LKIKIKNGNLKDKNEKMSEESLNWKKK